MKLGFHCFILTERWSDDALTILDRAVELGADCVEISTGDDVHFSAANTRARAERLGLTLVASPGGAWPFDCDLSADDPAQRARGLVWHQRQLHVAAEMGAVAYTGALYGHPGTVQRRFPPADEYPRTAEGLHALAECGSALGVEVVLEPMSHFRTHIANTPVQAMRLIEMADHANLRLLLDTYHMVTEVRDYGEAIRRARSRLWGIHACESDRGVPGGGLVLWEAVFAALRETDFDGYMILESYNSSIGDFAFRRGMFHNVCPDGEAFIRDGLAFVRRGLRG
jgi:D-psicose/D-tagatose/L-ribulose 3-epimerase